MGLDFNGALGLVSTRKVIELEGSNLPSWDFFFAIAI